MHSRVRVCSWVCDPHGGDLQCGEVLACRGWHLQQLQRRTVRRYNGPAHGSVRGAVSRGKVRVRVGSEHGGVQRAVHCRVRMCSGIDELNGSDLCSGSVQSVGRWIVHAVSLGDVRWDDGSAQRGM